MFFTPSDNSCSVSLISHNLRTATRNNFWPLSSPHAVQQHFHTGLGQLAILPPPYPWSNLKLHDHKTSALPAELSWPPIVWSYYSKMLCTHQERGRHTCVLFVVVLGEAGKLLHTQRKATHEHRMIQQNNQQSKKRITSPCQSQTAPVVQSAWLSGSSSQVHLSPWLSLVWAEVMVCHTIRLSLKGVTL